MKENDPFAAPDEGKDESKDESNDHTKSTGQSKLNVSDSTSTKPTTQSKPSLQIYYWIHRPTKTTSAAEPTPNTSSAFGTSNTSAPPQPSVGRARDAQGQTFDSAPAAAKESGSGMAKPDDIKQIDESAGDIARDAVQTQGQGNSDKGQGNTGVQPGDIARVRADEGGGVQPGDIARDATETRGATGAQPGEIARDAVNV
ncbi:hypothetical protein BDP27DRAFT_1319948 [Rhodocollybia butyracea]|uniref:Uncharacterized protein n=1 Tax=Rhodocollybia butyracea TaxID=206335 RepID=A0A9P5PZG9_9AGAR|nr:hypothetical protein BDP27DRAFT_1319948 [Rhodocollybia butyracea]